MFLFSPFLFWFCQPNTVFILLEVTPIRESKFNVSTDEKKRTYDGIVFDSQMEMKYYRDVVLPLSRSGEVTHYELQKPYILQPKFNNGSKNVLPIIYVADFYVEYADGHSEVVDVKGFADSAARLKRKIFWYKYPEINYKWLTYVKKYGGWVDWDYVQRCRNAARREKKKMEELENGED